MWDLQLRSTGRTARISPLEFHCGGQNSCPRASVPPCVAAKQGSLRQPTRRLKSAPIAKFRDRAVGRYPRRKNRPLVPPRAVPDSAACRLSRLSGRTKSRLPGEGSTYRMSGSSRGPRPGWQSKAATAISTSNSPGFLGCEFLAIIILRCRADVGGDSRLPSWPDIPRLDPAGVPRHLDSCLHSRSFR